MDPPAYLEKHGVQAALREAVGSIIKSQPDDPTTAIGEYLIAMGKKKATVASSGPFSFPSGLPDCCTASPDLYKTIAEIPGVGRLVEMTFPPGAKDAPHEHPIHSMYFVTDAKLKIAGPPTPTKCVNVLLKPWRFHAGTRPRSYTR